MASVPQEVIAPTVSAEHLTALQNTVVGFDREQLIWSSGFLAGLAGAAAPAIAVPAAVPIELPQADLWTIFYATETGSSRRVAEKLGEDAKLAGLAVEIKDLRDFRPKGLSRIENALFVLATHGIGEPPEGTELFFDFWSSDKAPQLGNLKYSILALGDSSYADFCEMGRVFDKRLKELGANPVVDRIDCDLDYDDSAASWNDNVIAYARENSRGVSAPKSVHLKSVAAAPLATRDNPFSAEILRNQAITGRGSSKDVRHIELDLEGSGLRYQPGDSLGVIPQNPPQLVDAILKKLRFTGSEEIVDAGRSTNLRDTLVEQKEITILNRPLLEKIASTHPDLQKILGDRSRFSDYLATRQLVDLIHEYPIDWQAQELADSLRRLTPRLYSIASGPDSNPDEAHLTVSVVNYEKFGRKHWGSASSYVTGGATQVPIYIESNDHFRLPDNGDTPIIMVGAGTGIAPYRAFMEQRQELGQRGDNWLIYGDRNMSSDFLYQLEWLRYRKEGLLTDLDVAFSRDQREKVYVQHRLEENAEKVYEWLQRGAHLYVCGDANHMAGDVHDTLLNIIREQADVSAERANEYLNELKQARRYQRDVY